MEAFKKGVVKPRRYRNRRLGDFLKELDLSEGKATGIPLIRKALRTNGSPDPVFNTDDDRTFFEVQFLVHPDFEDEVLFPNDDVPSEDDVPDEKLSENALRILSNMKKNPRISIPDLSYAIGVSTRSIEKNIIKLKKCRKIKRMGTPKSGYWEVL